MAAKILTQIFSGYANLAALEVAIDAFLATGNGAVVVAVHINDAGTEGMIFYYA